MISPSEIRERRRNAKTTTPATPDGDWVRWEDVQELLSLNAKQRLEAEEERRRLWAELDQLGARGPVPGAPE